MKNEPTPEQVEGDARFESGFPDATAPANASLNVALRSEVAPRSTTQPLDGAVPLGQQDTRLEDDLLVEAVRRGDTRASVELYRRLIRTIDHSVLRVLGARGADHDDIVQSCFEQVIKALAPGRFAGNCSLVTWAARIATNVALNVLRSKIRERRVFAPVDAKEEVSAPINLELQINARRELIHVRQVLARMNEKRSEVLILHGLHGYQLEEIASMLEITVSAAQSRLVRGRQEFLRRLSPKLHEGRGES